MVAIGIISGSMLAVVFVGWHCTNGHHCIICSNQYSVSRVVAYVVMQGSAGGGGEHAGKACATITATRFG